MKEQKFDPRAEAKKILTRLGLEPTEENMRTPCKELMKKAARSKAALDRLEMAFNNYNKARQAVAQELKEEKCSHS